MNLHDIQCLSLNTKKMILTVFLLHANSNCHCSYKNDPFIIYQVMRIYSGTCITLEIIKLILFMNLHKIRILNQLKHDDPSLSKCQSEPGFHRDIILFCWTRINNRYKYVTLRKKVGVMLCFLFPDPHANTHWWAPIQVWYLWEVLHDSEPAA